MTVSTDNTEVMIINYDDKQVDILHDDDEYTHANDHLCNLCTLRPKYLGQISENWYSKFRVKFFFKFTSCRPIKG